jgi:FMN phosphatase YigB (HAD superfamily)
MIGSVGFDHIFILTNKPISQRRSFFAFYYPSIKFISGVAKKPSPEGLLTISEKANVAPSQIALIDDRLLLGCLACIRAGCIPIWIKQPLKDYHTSPFKEAFFDIMRFSDRLLVR